MKVTFKSVDLQESRRHSVAWVGLAQSGEGFREKRTEVPKEEGGLPADGLQLFPGSPARWPALQVLDLPALTMTRANSLK